MRTHGGPSDGERRLINSIDARAGMSTNGPAIEIVVNHTDPDGGLVTILSCDDIVNLGVSLIAAAEAARAQYTLTKALPVVLGADVATPTLIDKVLDQMTGNQFSEVNTEALGPPPEQ